MMYDYKAELTGILSTSNTIQIINSLTNRNCY